MVAPQDALEYCATLLRHFADKLTEWEDGFVRSVQRQIEGGALSEKQADCLDKIIDRVARGYRR